MGVWRWWLEVGGGGWVGTPVVTYCYFSCVACNLLAKYQLSIKTLYFDLYLYSAYAAHYVYNKDSRWLTVMKSSNTDAFASFIIKKFIYKNEYALPTKLSLISCLIALLSCLIALLSCLIAFIILLALQSYFEVLSF